MTLEERQQKVIDVIRVTRDYVRRTYGMDFLPGLEMVEFEEDGLHKLKQWPVMSIVNLRSEE